MISSVTSKAKPLLVGALLPFVSAIALAGVAALGPEIFAGTNGNDQIAPYQFLNTLSFNAAIVFGLVGSALALNLRSRLALKWLLAGEIAAVVTVGAVVPAAAWEVLSRLPAPCAGQADQIGLSTVLGSGINPFWFVPPAASILLGTFAGKATVGVRRRAVFALAAFFVLLGVFTLFSTIDNGVVEVLWFHC